MNGGAVAYLAHSQYGRNRNEVSINNSYITGNSAGKPGDWSTAPDETYTYNTGKGMLSSTTGNIYGVYDMNGGSDESTATWCYIGEIDFATGEYFDFELRVKYSK